MALRPRKPVLPLMGTAATICRKSPDGSAQLKWHPCSLSGEASAHAPSGLRILVKNHGVGRVVYGQRPLHEGRRRGHARLRQIWASSSVTSSEEPAAKRGLTSCRK